ncbi:MAG TPA: hypothetical protein VFG07_02185 [Thermoplasmata archaeon]|nr:hypothetical protein [Thermoplasmata archaeon]
MGASVVAPPRASRRRQGLVMLGLLVTFVALGSVALGLPTAIALSGPGVGYLALGSVGLFVGGGLLGYAAGARRR